MYFPYFRGKQEEVLALIEVQDVIAAASQVPIIEIVRSSATATNRLETFVNDLSALGGSCIIISNPRVGNFSQNSSAALAYIGGTFAQNPNVIFGVIIDDSTTAAEINNVVNVVGIGRTAFVHQSQSPIPNIQAASNGAAYQVFFDGLVGPAYINSFNGSPKVRIVDGFRRLNNADYAPNNFFSSNHATFAQDGFNGFGDFLTVGNFFQERGGAAYAVAIHLTYFTTDPLPDEMHIRHFISITNATQQNPGGKFAEALNSLMNHYNGPSNVLAHTRGLQGFFDLHAAQRYSGLGVPKRYSMMHHMEIMARRFP